MAVLGPGGTGGLLAALLPLRGQPRLRRAPADPAQAPARYDAFPPGAKSSMQRDAEAGRPLELDAIGGALLCAADRHGVPVPVTDRLVGEVRAAGH